MKQSVGRRFLFQAAICLSLLLTNSSVRSEAMLQLFNLTWNEVAEKIPEVAEAGYTSFWLPPPTKGNSGLSVGYDLFDPFDLGDKNQRGTIRTRYGTKAELQRMVAIAHRFGMRVYFDNIMNHRGGEVPGYNSFVPTNLYPGTVPGDFHLRTTSDGFYRNASNIRDYNSVWQVQNLSLLGLVDIAHESPNANFGPTEGSTAPKPIFVRHPNNPEYYDEHPTLGRVGFGRVTQSDLNVNPSFYREDVNAYLLRSVRWLFHETRCDGLRLDAVKHVPSYFFGQQTGIDRDTSSAGYVGSAQLQFNLAHGFTDSNHRNSNFDAEAARNDALILGEHLGEPPGFGEYVDAGMRLLDNPLRNHLNNVLGNPSASLSGLDQRDAGGFSAAVRVMHAQSHDNDFAARRELQNAYYFMREGIPLIYSDGYNESPSGGGTPFPRHANAPYLGQFTDNKMPDLAWLHHQLARGGTRPRWSDSDVVAFERYEYREPGSAADQTVVLFAMNDNYGNPGDVSFDDAVAQNDSGMPSTCYPVVNSRGQGLVVGFPPGTRLRQMADSPGDSRACPELLVRLATNNRNEATSSANDADPGNRKVYVGGQSLASGGGAIEFKVPSGSYVAYAIAWPEASRVDTTLPNSSGVLGSSDAIVLMQGGRAAPRALLYRTDGKDGDAGFNPLYPFKMRGSVDLNGNVVRGNNVSNRTYAISVPLVTNAPMDFLARVDGSAVNVLLRLDGGVDLNSHLSLGVSNTTTGGMLDLRDNKPGAATDVFLGYEATKFDFRYGPEKFAARNVVRGTVRSPGAETYIYVVGSSVATNRVDGNGYGNDFSTETPEWVYHDPVALTTLSAGTNTTQRSATDVAHAVEIWAKVGYQGEADVGHIYFTGDGSEPNGAFGVTQGPSDATAMTFVARDAQDTSIEWWRGTIPGFSPGTTVKYKIAFFNTNAATIESYKDTARYGLSQFGVKNWNPASARIWLHNSLNTNDAIVGLPEGFHIMRARAFIPRNGKSSVYNTFLQTFYFDSGLPDGVIAFPGSGETLRSTEYGVVVRADDTVTEVEYNIIDSNPNNDDVVTGFHNGNGLSNGVPVFASATLVTPLASLSQQYPNFPQEFRFNYEAVPSSGTATLTVRLKELTTSVYTNRFRTLSRSVNTLAPAQTLSFIAPASNGQTISLSNNAPYTIIVCFSDTLTADPDLFTIRIDGEVQPRTNSTGTATYRIQGTSCGSGKRDLRYDWSGMGSGQHYLEVLFNGDGLSLQASRFVRVTVFGATDTDGDGLPDAWEMEHQLDENDSTGVNGPDGDPDNDRFRNIEEYLAGTDPRDSESLLEITSQANGGRRLTWKSVPGKAYRVYATAMVTEAFEPLSGAINATTTTATYADPAPAVANKFYRVEVLP